MPQDLLKPQTELPDSMNEKTSPKVPAATELLPCPYFQADGVYKLGFWRLSNEGWPKKLAFAYFPIRSRARQQLPKLPTARAQTVQT